MTAPFLRLKGVGCARGDRLLLRGIDLDLSPGQAALLRGANGIGKSSLLRLCAGLLRPYAGSVDRHGAAQDRELVLALHIAAADVFEMQRRRLFHYS